MAEVARELDVRDLSPPKRHSEIFRTFDALEPGEGFVLINDHDPKPLLYQFQAEHPGRFDWSVLEAGPDRFRVEIRRRAAAGPRNITEYLEGDHRRLDAILAEVERLVEAHCFLEAGRRFGEFACGLSRHIDAEECVLFPAFEEMTGSTSGPTMVMRSEHVEIRQLMEVVASAINTQDTEHCVKALRVLGGVLDEHNAKEEKILYPMADNSAGSDRARDDLVRRMQAL